MGSITAMVNGHDLVREEMRVLKRIRISPAGDRFLPVMEVSEILTFALSQGRTF